MKRIHRLLYPEAHGVSWMPVASAGFLFTALAVSLGAWTPSQTPASPAATVTTDTYHRWLNEDVVYIIDDAERSAFLRLTTDEERTHFIEQFWDRRSGEPAKKEHYRRIAFANKHFGTPATEGWRTDRGHMYILYGPPDEIDSHPKASPHPWESWGYRNTEAGGVLNLFRFVDAHDSGDFRLAPSSEH